MLSTVKMSPISSVQIYSDDEIEAGADRYSLGHRTKTKRESSKNELTVEYGTKYRDPENTRDAESEADGQVAAVGKSLCYPCSLHVWAKFAF